MLGFSPFELVYGHTVEDSWNFYINGIDDEGQTYLLSYVAKFRERLRETWTRAKQNLKVSRDKLKIWFERLNQ